MADHLETYEGNPEPANRGLGLSDWISLLHHYLNYNSLPTAQLLGHPTYSDSDYQPAFVGGRTLQGADQPQSGIGIWNLGQGTGFSLDKMPTIDKHEIMNPNPTLQNWR